MIKVTVILIMSVVATDGSQLVQVRMPYETTEKCEAAAHSARWVLPAGLGLEAVAKCEAETDADIAL